MLFGATDRLVGDTGCLCLEDCIGLFLADLARKLFCDHSSLCGKKKKPRVFCEAAFGYKLPGVTKFEVDTQDECSRDQKGY